MKKSIVFLKEKNTRSDGSNHQMKDNYEEVFKHAGFDTSFLPVISFDFGSSERKLELYTKLLNFEDYAGLVFTSSTGFDSCVEAILANDANFEKRLIKFGPAYNFIHKPCFVVGPASKRTALSIGFSNVLLPEADDGNAVALANFIYECKCKDSIPYTDWKKPLLIVTSSIRRPTLTSILSSHGVMFEEVFSYDTTSNTNLWSSLSQIPVHSSLVFFSPSGVTSILSHIQDIVKFMTSPSKDGTTDNNMMTNNNNNNNDKSISSMTRNNQQVDTPVTNTVEIDNNHNIHTNNNDEEDIDLGMFFEEVTPTHTIDNKWVSLGVEDSLVDFSISIEKLNETLRRSHQIPSQVQDNDTIKQTQISMSKLPEFTYKTKSRVSACDEEMTAERVVKVLDMFITCDKIAIGDTTNQALVNANADINELIKSLDLSSVNDKVKQTLLSLSLNPSSKASTPTPEGLLTTFGELVHG